MHPVTDLVPENQKITVADPNPADLSDRVKQNLFQLFTHRKPFAANFYPDLAIER